jgi:lipoprotein-anchoring transpeptidase ErfK/SrfK
MVALACAVSVLAIVCKLQPASAQLANDKVNSPKNGLVVSGEPLSQRVPFMFGIFDAQRPELQPLTEEQTQLDVQWAELAKQRKYSVGTDTAPVEVRMRGYVPGSIVIDTHNKHLFFIETPFSAIRYTIAVGQEGLTFTGETTVGDKQAWPRWTPTKEMIGRNPGHYKRYEEGMDGGLKNPLGARAIYLHIGKQDTYLRIHGTNDPKSIGTASSNGCFRMHNQHVMDLYQRVKMGAKVIVL